MLLYNYRVFNSKEVEIFIADHDTEKVDDGEISQKVNSATNVIVHPNYDPKTFVSTMKLKKII